jgi:hypothetical protein
LHVGDVVEVRALRVERQPVARVDLEAEQLADRKLVFGTVEALGRTRARVRIPLRCAIEVLLDRLDQREQRVAAGCLTTPLRSSSGIATAGDTDAA